MKVFDKYLKTKDIEYYSFGKEFDEVKGFYWYLQTSNNIYEDYEIICSKHKIIPLVVGKIISFINKKKLVKW